MEISRGASGGNVVGIPQAALEPFLASLTTAISDAVVVGIDVTKSSSESLAAPSGNVINAINSFNTQSIDLTSKEGKQHWLMTAKKEKSWKPLMLTTKNTEARSQTSSRTTRTSTGSNP
jgi:hypothetical protein